METIITHNTSFTNNTKFILKMNFINNALENGWEVKKMGDSYIFVKDHEGKKEIFSDSYLTEFVKENFNMIS
jgi:hypothetical protein